MAMRYLDFAFLLLLAPAAAEAVEPSKSNGNPQSGPSQGLTLEDIGRGLKSAARNIEQEIPKMGAAIGNAVKKVTEKEPGKPAEDKPSKSAK